MSADVALITGTSTGIGRAAALRLARHGYRVFATMRSPERAGAPLLDVARAEKLHLSVLRLDVTDPKSVEQAVAQAIAEAGRIDILVNNAGIGDLGAIETLSDEIMRTMFETNVFGAVRAIRAVLPGMRARGSGTIVNVTSVAGLLVALGNGLYAASKHALEAISEALALEARQYGVRVAIIEPGLFDTPIIDKSTGVLGADEASPYAHVARRIGGIYMAGRATNPDVEVVAAAIEHAISTDQPRLRYLVGVDARPFVDGRARMTDEEYVRAFGRAQTDDEFFTEFAARFPMPGPA
jgi:NAD(P)-dependent dehydrogenase (short-subunit alcohol dehydrogenase family)